MATGTRSEATAAPAAAQPERKSAPASSSRALPDAVLQIQATAGNAAVARMSAARRRARCSAAARTAGAARASTGHGAEEEMLDEQFGLLRTAVARRSA
jgi:hypothetical protein